MYVYKYINYVYISWDVKLKMPFFTYSYFNKYKTVIYLAASKNHIAIEKTNLN